ncbi:unnamed protein product [Urochloa humidicola]
MATPTISNVDAYQSVPEGEQTGELAVFRSSLGGDDPDRNVKLIDAGRECVVFQLRMTDVRRRRLVMASLGTEIFSRRKVQRAEKANRAARAAGSKVSEVMNLRYKRGHAYTDWLMDEWATLSFRRILSAGGDQEAIAAAGRGASVLQAHVAEYRCGPGGLLRDVLCATTAVRAVDK